MKWLFRLRGALEGAMRPQRRGVSDRGFLVFSSTSEVIRAEALLREAGIEAAVKGPPPKLRQGCDMVVEFRLLHKMHVCDVLAAHGLEPLLVADVEDGLLEPVSLFHVKELAGYLMVRAANMKITVDPRDGRIVNISGGGCPDVPYLAETFVGASIHGPLEPRSLGRTLCSYALQLAFEEARCRCRG